MTTGYAVFHWEMEHTDLHGNIPYHSFVHDLALLLTEWRIKEAVVEKPVIVRGPLGDKMQNLIRWTNEMCETVHEVSPSQWKPHPLSQMPLPHYLSPHEKDAVRLGIWWRKFGLQGHA